MKVLIVTAMYPKPENPAFGSFVRTQVESLRRAGVDVELLLLQGRSRKWNYLKAIFQLRERLAKGSFDLVHAHYGLAGMVGRTEWKVPVVVTFHGDDLLGTVNTRGKKTLLSALIVAAGRRLARSVDAVIVQSQEMARKLESEAHRYNGNQAEAVIVKSRDMASKLKRENVHIIPHEIDFDVFQPVEKEQARALLGLDPHKKYLLFAANPKIPVKRFPLAQAVAEELQKQDPSVELLAIYKETQDRLALFMGACDALIFTSYQEGSPNVVKQAMACNLPIVSTDVGDVRDVIGSTKGCYVCKPDVKEFAEILAGALSPGERTRGREKVSHLSGPAVAQKVIAVYEQVLSRRKGHAVDRLQGKPVSAGK